MTALLHRRFLSLPAALALVLWAGPVQSAPSDQAEKDKLVQVAKQFAKTLGEGKTDPEKIPELVISPFCPPERARAYGGALKALADRLKERVFRVEEPTVQGDFGGCLAVLQHSDNPLELEVEALCFLRTKDGWKVTAGLRHFDNTNLGFEPGREEGAAAVASRIRALATSRRDAILNQAAAEVRKKALEIRKGQLAKLDREKLVRAYLDFDRKHDVLGKLACILVPDDIPPEKLSKVLAELKDPIVDQGSEHEGEDKSPGNPMKMLLVASQEKDDEHCLVFGFYDSDDLTNYFVQPFYLVGRDNSDWRIFPDGLEVDDLPSVGADLQEWFGKTQSGLAADLMKKIGSQAGEAGAATPAEAHRRFFEAALKRDGAAALAVIPIAPAVNDDTEALDSQLEALGQFWNQIRRTEMPQPVSKEVGESADDDVSAAIHAVFQPFAPGGTAFQTVSTLAVRRDNRWWCLPWSKANDLPWDDPNRAGLEKLQTKLGKETSDEAISLKILGSGWVKPAQPEGPAALVADSDPALRAFAEKIVNHATARELLSLLELAVQPPGNQSDRGMRALREVAEIVRDCRPGDQGKTTVLGVASSGNWAGITLSMPLPKREDGKIPARMIMACKQENTWRWVPGLQVFREVNRGYKALNVKTLDYWKDSLPLEDAAHVETLRRWLDSSSGTNP